MLLRTASIAAATILATAAPAAAQAGSLGGGPGWNYIDTYPGKVECVTAGQAGVPQQWDDWRCEPHIDPLGAGEVGQTGGWDLWAVVYVG